MTSTQPANITHGFNAYLIDGVAINGVSGWPVMYATGADGVQIVGSVSAHVDASSDD